MTQMQGIVSILRSDNLEITAQVSPLRRTLSADMSSKRWLAENGLPTMKKIASSEQIAIDSSSSSESDEEECEVNGKGDKNPSRMDIWTAIMSQKKQDDSGKLPPPYVHPLVKKSARSLSEKSLKVCTESLGSETGSDVFMFNPVASSEDATKEQHKPQEQPQPHPQQQSEQYVEHKVVRHASPTTKKAHMARSFPPPLPSLAAAHTEGPSLHMHSRRVEGRLVLEAVSVPPQKYFEAQRQDGRFLLALIKDDPIEVIEQPQPIQNEFVDVFNISEEEKSIDNDNENEYEDEDEYEDNQMNMNFIDKDLEIIKEPPLDSTTKFINVHKSTITKNKFAERDNENPTWSRKLNTELPNVTKVTDQDQEATITQSLPPVPRNIIKGRPPLPRPPTATSVNSYQYFWRSKQSVASVIDPMITQQPPPTKTKDMVLFRGNKSDCLIPSAISCKVPRKSLVMWEPFCIATS
uniref:protein FAF-like, chloroplastic n=1 Tax=Erigeron canadensis TaxID=72917 RepID=UPI001CB97C8F|nr:protein FAF-like, chloroplastic [Erigeron canadensis]